MIWDSGPWKRGLIKDAEILSRWAKKKSSNMGEVIFEKKIFISAYCIRKLIDAEKIGFDFPGWNITVETFFRINKDIKITFLNNHKVDFFYDLKMSTKASISLKTLSNIIIHSYVFLVELNEDEGVDSFFVTSDKDKEKLVYKVNLRAFVKMLQDIGYADVNQLSLKVDSDKKSSFAISRTYISE